MEESIDYCLRDYRNHHNWISLGAIVRPDGQIAEALKCTQCSKCRLVNLEEITRVFS
jgi:hypothetical protein